MKTLDNYILGVEEEANISEINKMPKKKHLVCIRAVMGQRNYSVEINLILVIKVPECIQMNRLMPRYS